MSQKKIPAQILITCDICKKECDRSNRIQSGELHLNCSAVDWSGVPVADGSRHWDLCDSCLHGAAAAIDKYLKERTKGVGSKHEGLRIGPLYLRDGNG